MCGRIKAALDARMDDDLLIVTRTDARTTEYLEAALERAEAYQEAGADVIFVKSPKSEDEMRLTNSRMTRPTLANMVEGGRTPFLPAATLQAIGYRIAIYPYSLTRTFARTGQRVLRHLKAGGTSQGMADLMMNHRELWNLFEYDTWTETERRLSGG
jgi:2-methylisocitrate lyase-like PEP mutase family enzyme